MIQHKQSWRSRNISGGAVRCLNLTIVKQNAPSAVANWNANSLWASALPPGYNASCPHCGKYNDIWACGIREVDCGSWHSDSFLSSYGTPTEEELAVEKQNLRKLNRLIVVEKVKWFFQQLFHRSGSAPVKKNLILH